MITDDRFRWSSPSVRARGLHLRKRHALPATVSLMKAGRVMQLGAFRQIFVSSDAAKEQCVRADLLAVHDGQLPNGQQIQRHLRKPVAYNPVPRRGKNEFVVLRSAMHAVDYLADRLAA